MISVLALGADPLIIAAEHEDVSGGDSCPLPIVEVVRNESNDPLFADVDLRGEEFRVDRGERLGLQLVPQVVGRQLSDVPDSRKSFDEDRVPELHLFERANDDVFHGKPTSGEAAGVGR